MKIKKNYVAPVLFLCILFISSCSDDSHLEPYITAGLVSEVTIPAVDFGNSYVTELAFVARVHVPSDDGTYVGSGGADERYMLRMPLNRSGMTLRFPENPPQSLLCSIVDDIPTGFSISDMEAKTISFVEIGCCVAGSNHISGQLRFSKSNDYESFNVIYIYCDRVVDITGSGKDWWGHPTTYNLHLERGWNMVVEYSNYREIQGRRQTVSNQLPGGMKWSYGMWLGSSN